MLRVRIDPEVLQSAIAFLLVALLLALFLKRDLGVAAREVTQRQLVLGIRSLHARLDRFRFFPCRHGDIIFFILMALVGLTIVEVAATQMSPFIALAMVSSLLFAWTGLIDFRVGLVFMAGGAFGGHFGTRIPL